MKGKVLARAQQLWCDRNSKYRKFNYDPYPNEEVKRKKCPKAVRPKDWERFLELQREPRVIACRERGKVARKAMNRPHTSGRRGSGRTTERLRKKNPKVLVFRTDVYLAKHMRVDGSSLTPELDVELEKTARLTLEEDLVHVKDKLTTMNEKLSSLAAGRQATFGSATFNATESPSSMRPSLPIALSSKELPCELLSFTGKIVASERAIGDSHSAVYNVIIDDMTYNPNIDSADRDPSLSSLNDVELGTTIIWAKMTKLPRDLKEDILEAISIQPLGQGTELRIGLVIESQTATLSVKRRLACEQLSYFAQSHYCLSGCDFNHGYGKKHILFIKWKYIEAKAAAYYYHGLILDKGTEPSSYINAVCCFLAADELLTDSKKACLSFCLSKSVARAPSLWGVMKHLHQRIPEVVSRKSQMYDYLLEQDKALQTLHELPYFALSLRPDDYKLPEIDTTWSCEEWETQVQTLKGHLENEPESELFSFLFLCIGAFICFCCGLSSISNQALGQGEELQPGLAIESQAATLSIKRRLACKQLSYFAQVDLPCPNYSVLYRNTYLLFLDYLRKESCIENSWFEVLSVLHMITILLFLEANSLLVHKNLIDASERNISEDCKKDSIDLLLKASGYLEFCVNHIVGHLPKEIKTKLPRDLWEGVLDAISIQALDQVPEL
ncbi:hypothetical protein GIB67_035326 [Kingdonia uniflora]|uniref:Uncharacterized protein n=1 Tax=Kingdonia uniflora TaxID=39325 RepID=A0A7J7LY91_9MAGN|nr:hypothetical protein GIB67_035326 [Kingdonia uniflora]